MTREQWLTAYRDARKFDRFQNRFWPALKKVRGPVSFHQFAVLPCFDMCRLHGDILRYGTTRGQTYRLNHLRGQVPQRRV